MSQCHQSTDGFIKTLFGPRVAVLCSQDAEIISRRNNLSFAELIRPFCTLNKEIQVRDPANQLFAIKDLHITICDLRCNVPDENAGKQVLAEVVSDASTFVESSTTFNIEGERYQVNVSMSCPWFEAYRDTLTSMASQKPHEFINHCPSCLLVVSSSHPDPIKEFTNLSQHQNQIQHNSQHAPLRWMTPNTLKFYVLLHDNSNADKEKANKVMSDLQGMYGNGACYLLHINSKVTDEDLQLPDPWGRFLNRRVSNLPSDINGINMNDIKIVSDNLNVDPLTVSTEVNPNDVKWVKDLKKSAVIPQKGYGCCLTLQDHDSLRTFMQEFAMKGLIPHIEKLIRNFSEHISSRKAIHRSLFRATRTFFGGSKAASAPALKNYGGGGLESPELQMRKLADLLFLCQMYDQAYQYYHSVRKDFANEQAWVHAAGASEMAALSNFMQLRAQRPYPAHYVDAAIDTYLKSGTDNYATDQYLAIRCALVSLECLRTQGLYNEAAMQLKRLVNENNDLQSAIVWEQVAQCHLRTKKPLLRKFAFYTLLAGHRYYKALQRNCAILCYKSALQVYNETGWNVAIDFINFTVGKLSLQMQQFDNAVESFKQLLKESSQHPSQQAMYLNEYLHVARLLTAKTNSRSELTLPVIQPSKMVFRSSDISTNSLPGEKWKFLETSVITVARTNSSGSLMTLRKKNNPFSAVVNEPLWVDIAVYNPLHVALALREARLLLEFTTDSVDDNIENSQVQEFIIGENCESVITFALNPHCTGKIKVLGISYTLGLARITSFPSQMNLGNVELGGRQMFEGSDLEIIVCNPMPKLDVIFEDGPMKLVCGEIKATDIVLANIGQCGMSNIKVAYDSVISCLFSLTNQTLNSTRKHFLQAACMSSDSLCYVQDLYEGELKPGEQLKLQFWLQAPFVEDIHALSFLFYYESSDGQIKEMPHRLLNYTSDVYTRQSLDFGISVNQENSQDGLVVVSEVKNTSLSYSFSCHQLAAYSHSWKIATLATSRPLEIGVGQMTAFYFLVKDDNSFGQEENSGSSIQAIGLIFNTSSDSSTLEPLYNPELKLSTVSESGKVVSNSFYEYLTVALQWSAHYQNQQLMGQHYIHFPDLDNNYFSMERIGIPTEAGTISDRDRSLVALHQLVKWKFDFVKVHRHDFKNSGLCFVNVKITLQNRYDCELRVNVNGMDSNQSLNPSSSTANTRFLWAGKSLSKFLLQPKQSRTVVMVACFSSPGVYNLNSFTVWAVPVQIENETPLLPQNCHYSSLVTVHESIYDS